MKQDFTIRLATRNDVPHLAEVERSAALAFRVLPDYNPTDRTVPADTLNAMAAAGLLWVAVTNDGHHAGFVGCEDKGDYLYIHEISVASEFQKQGIGRALMQTVIQTATDKNYEAVGLTTRRDAAWNKPFYTSLGFVETSDKERWPVLIEQLVTEIGHGADPAIRCAMIRLLMSDNYSFRNGTPDDAARIFAFLQQLAEHEGQSAQLKLTHETLLQALSGQQSNVRALLCDHAEKPVGMALWCERFSPYAGGMNLLLIDLYVDPAHRGQGLGQRFIAELKTIAKEHGFVRLEWFVDKDNDTAKRFYTKLGGGRIERSEHWKLDLV